MIQSYGKDPMKCVSCGHYADDADKGCDTCWYGDGDNPEIIHYVDKDDLYHDQHYQGDVQPIELMQAHMSKEEFCGFLRGNVIKYACRIGKKDDPLKELDKLLRYGSWLKEALQGKKINPRI